MKSPHLRLFLNIFTLHALVVAKPLFDVFANYPEYFVINRIHRLDIVWFVLFISFALPAIVAAPLLAIQQVAKKRGGQIHLIAVGVYGAGYLLQLVSRIEMLPLFSTIVLGAAAGIGVALLYWRNARFPLVISLLSPIVFIFPLLFFFDDNMRSVFSPQDPAVEKRVVEGPSVIESKPPIIMVVFDEFPLTDMLDAQGEIDAIRFPRFSAFAGESTWYKNATTVWPNTAGAVPAILSGKRPQMPLPFPNYENHPENVFTMLQNHYTFNVNERTTNMVPRDAADGGADVIETTPFSVVLHDAYIVYLHLLLPKTLTEKLPRIDQGWGHFGRRTAVEPAPPTEPAQTGQIAFQNIDPEKLHESGGFSHASQFRSFVRSIGGYPESTLHFIHLLFPHEPHEYLPSGKLYSRSSKMIGIDRKKPAWKGSEGAFEKLHHALRLQAALTDRFLGDLLDSLKTNGTYDESLIIITADHGASYINAYPHRAPTLHTFGDIAFVPLFIKYPNQTEGNADDSNVETIDIVPTIRDVIGATLNWAFDGRSLLDVSAEPRPTKILPDTFGKVLELTRTEYLDAKMASLKRNIDMFSLKDSKAGPFRFGKGLEFIGQPESVLNSMVVDATIRCEGLDALHDVDLNSYFLNLRLDGTVSSAKGVPSDLYLAFSVNGKIELFSKPMNFHDEFLFEVILPEDAIRQGKNTIKVFLVDLERV
jgi:hypothetical protein